VDWRCVSRESRQAGVRKNVDLIDALQYARDLAEQHANLPTDFDEAHN